ncbi:hypothetical protein ACLOJK_023436 [Asimina triloba]
MSSPSSSTSVLHEQYASSMRSSITTSPQKKRSSGGLCRIICSWSLPAKYQQRHPLATDIVTLHQRTDAKGVLNNATPHCGARVKPPSTAPRIILHIHPARNVQEINITPNPRHRPDRTLSPGYLPASPFIYTKGAGCR